MGLRFPPIAPRESSQDAYLVLDDFGGRLGRAWRETDEEMTFREVLIQDLMSGQYSNPARIVAFNAAEGWSRDVTKDIADELRRSLCGIRRSADLGAGICGNRWPSALSPPKRHKR
jgi:hypothetical protein